MRKTFFITNADGSVPAPSGEPPPESAAPTATTPTGSEKCTFHLNASPTSSLEFDGSSLGMTPKSNVEVAAGEHEVRFTAPGGVVKALSLKCKPGETRTVVVRVES